MARTAITTDMHLLNALTQKELILESRNQFIKVGSETIIGDIYRDPDEHSFAIVLVHRTVQVKDLEDLAEDTGETPTKDSRVSPVNPNLAARLQHLKQRYMH